MDNKNEYSNLFHLKDETIPIVKQNNIVEPNKNLDTQLESDFELSRTNIMNVLEHSSSILDSVIELCKITDSPRAFEATSSLITAITSASKDLIEVHERYNKLKNIETQQNITTQNNVQNNIVFKGTSKELLELIKSN